MMIFGKLDPDFKKQEDATYSIRNASEPYGLLGKIKISSLSPQLAKLHNHNLELGIGLTGRPKSYYLPFSCLWEVICFSRTSEKTERPARLADEEVSRSMEMLPTKL